MKKTIVCKTNELVKKVILVNLGKGHVNEIILLAHGKIGKKTFFKVR